MPLLIVRQAAGSPGDMAAQFLLAREDGQSRPEPVAVPAAHGFPVEARPQSDLMAELRWYLESFLEYPFPPETERAERVLRALRSWGEAAFGALFGDREGSDFLAAATVGGHDKLRLQIRSDDPGVLSWPWEALHDPCLGPLGQLCQIERRLNAAGDPPPPSSALPRDCIHILLITARPYEQDVAYRTISRPLVELIARHEIPAHVHLLRPPTFERLREHLRERPGFYHILHFDGHGGYLTPPRGTAPAALSAAFTFAARVGTIVFEDENGGPAYVWADRLAPLLLEMAVPVVVLNACRSAMLDADAESAFASVSAALLQSGTRSVVAMAYNLYVSAAQVLLPAFYGRLFASGSVPDAIRAGRQAMAAKCERLSIRGRFPLSDWLVPVLYQHEDFALSFTAEVPAGAAPLAEPPQVFGLENEARLPGFVGRDSALLRLERALRRRPSGILIHGLGGVGKTALAQGLLDWLRDTDGLGAGAFWFSFQEIHSAEHVWNRLGEWLIGSNFSAAVPPEDKVFRLAEVLREHPFLIVWDNFEVVAGLPEEKAAPALSAPGREELKAFLSALDGGASKVVITSRSEERWLGGSCSLVTLAGLQGEERWEYCEALLDELGFQVNRGDPDLKELMDLLDGHPLAMRVILRELERRPARSLIEGLASDLESLELPAGDETARLFATLRLPFARLPEKLRPLLVPLALHERFVEGNHLEVMAGFAESALSRAHIDLLLARLAAAGLLRELEPALYQMHPALTGYLRSRELESIPQASRTPWIRGFVDVFGLLADGIAPRPLDEQRGAFSIHQANFRAALREAERQGMKVGQAALLQALAVHAQNLRDFTEAAELFESLAEIDRERGHESGAGNAYHQLGMIAAELHDYPAAEQWSRRSLEIAEKAGDEDDVATSCLLLGEIARQRRDFATAEAWYRKALEIRERGNDPEAAESLYHQMGILAQDQGDFAAAEVWYQKTLEIREAQGDEPRAASLYHQLGTLAQARQDFPAAEQWYRRALKIKETIGNEYDTVSTLHNLGTVAQQQLDYAAAERWYRKCVRIVEQFGDELSAARTYFHLGTIAQAQYDFSSAGQWYEKALLIEERIGSEHSAAISSGQLGILATLEGRFEESGRWFLRALETLLRLDDPAGAERAMSYYVKNYRSAPPRVRRRLRALWREAGLGRWPFDGVGRRMVDGLRALLDAARSALSRRLWIVRQSREE